MRIRGLLFMTAAVGLLAWSRPALATAGHQVVALNRSGNGVRATVRLNPAPGYNTVKFGVSPGNASRTSYPALMLENGLRLSSTVERTYHIPLGGQFQPGGTVTFISHWPGPG